MACFTLRMSSERVADAVVVCMRGARERIPQGFWRCNAHEAAIKNVKQGYPRSQLAFRVMTRKTHDVPHCKAVR